MKAPLVSVLISVYNAGRYLRPALMSVLSQTYQNLEVIIIDDGSTDDCLASISDILDPRIRVFRQKNSGKSVALNFALDVLRGDYYAIHDADDISYPGRFERQVEILEKNPRLGAVFTGYDIRLDDKPHAPRFAEKGVEQCRADIESMRMPSHDPTVMYRVEKVRSIRYEPSLRIGQGLDYILQVGELHPMQVIGECLYSYRVYSASSTRKNSDSRRQMIRAVKRRAAMRRGIDGPAEERNKSDSSGAEYGITTHFLESALDFKRSGAKFKALRIALRCAFLRPFVPAFYKPLVYAVIPLFLVKAHRLRTQHKNATNAAYRRGELASSR